MGYAEDAMRELHEGPTGGSGITVRVRPVLYEVQNELIQARATHAPMNGHHEGYAVMLEEMDELWEVCKRNTHSFEHERPKWATHVDPLDKEALRKLKRAAMRKEAMQIAAMAVRFIEDVCDKVSTQDAGGFPSRTIE